MALVSPGVEVTITDQSQYLPAVANSIPFVLVATAQNKANPTGTGVAAATTPANAGKLFRVTSQRDLVTLYGNPFFYTTTDGTPIQGYELNEYGLLAAYSALGVTNSLYCLRADIDLASLVGQAGRPTGTPADGTYWLDTTTTTWGIFEFSSVTGQFTVKTPIVINDATNVSGGAPLVSLGSIGDYAVIALQTTAYPSATSAKQYFYKSPSNTWVGLGTLEWLQSVPTVTGTESNPPLTPGDEFDIDVNGEYTATIQVPGGASVFDVANEINNLGWTYLSAGVNAAEQLTITSSQLEDQSTPKYITLTNVTNQPLTDMGIDEGTYYQAITTYGTSAEQPLWSSSQTYPRPSGSVWIKVGAAGGGLTPVVAQWNGLINSWTTKNVALSTSDWDIIDSSDATGGKAIPAGTVYAQYDYNDQYSAGPVYLWERVATGPTVITGSVTNPTFTNGPYLLNIRVSIPGSSSLSSVYVMSLADSTDATDFVTAWAATAIPYTTATVTTSGAIQLTHTEGGVILMDDIDPVTDTSSGLIDDAGFVVNSTDGCKYGPAVVGSTVATTASGGTGGGLELNVSFAYEIYDVTGIANAGAGYVVGDIITFAGTDFGGTSPANDLVVQVTAAPGSNVSEVTYISGEAPPNYWTQLSNWVGFTYEANEGAPVAAPDNNTNWFYSVVDQVDIMVKTTAGWRGYKNTNYDSNGFPTPTGSNTTDPLGPLVTATAPTVQSDGTALAYGDLWIDTSDLDNYPVIYRWQFADGEDKWVLIDNTDQVSGSGILFADARWATNGTTNPANDPIPSITSLLTSNYLDLDAPNPALYPVGMMLFNTRRSGYNVKQYRVNYFNGISFPDAVLPTEKDAWVSTSGLQSNGAPYMGRKAQRAMVVQSLRAAIDTNVAIRDEDNFFNLMCTPNYPELQPNMVVLNGDRGDTSYILGDTPMRLPMQATAIEAWATNAAGATSTGEEGCVTRNTYLGLFYPSGITSDLNGNLVAVPPSHMVLRTFLKNDQVAFPWLAAAGTRRGAVDNATNIGYIDPTTGEFVTIKTPMGIRDVLYTNFINPIVFFTGNGILNFGNKTSFNSQSALDRTNVARLAAYLRRALTIAARPFVFEPNDAITRAQISGVIETLLVDLVAKRGIYDYLVVCDESNNTPARIDRNELWVDVAVEPVKAAEFIYIPVRVMNTGEIAG